MDGEFTMNPKLTTINWKAICFTLIFFFLIGGLMFIVLRALTIGIDYDGDKICEAEYGEGWKYDLNEIFGRTCVKINFINLNIEDRKLLNMTHAETAEKYCNQPGIFDITKWKSGCLK